MCLKRSAMAQPNEVEAAVSVAHLVLAFQGVKMAIFPHHALEIQKIMDAPQNAKNSRFEFS